MAKGYLRRQIRDGVTRALRAPRPEPTAADLDADLWRVRWTYHRPQAWRSIDMFVLAVDATHAVELACLRLVARGAADPHGLSLEPPHLVTSAPPLQDILNILTDECPAEHASRQARGTRSRSG